MISHPALIRAPRVFCALDTQDLPAALALAGAMQEAGCGIKLGLEFFCAQGPQGVRAIRDAYPALALFLDLKFHDIPNTVAQAVEAACAFAPDFMTLHAGGGIDMMRAAQDSTENAASRFGVSVPQLLAVTVLTSLDDAGLRMVGQKTPAAQQVLNLAERALESGIRGIVCAGPEIAAMRREFGTGPILMVPGIRPEGMGAEMQDQKRVMTPLQAVRDGATHLVIGRPITKSPDPVQAARAILSGIEDSILPDSP